MKYGSLFIAVLAFVFTTACAQEKGSDAKKSGAGMESVSLKGYVVDQMCAKGMAKKADPMQKAASHSKDCCLEDHCSAAGYGLFSDGKYYPFDTDGSKKAMGLIEKEKREKGLAYEVTGSYDGSVLKVASMKATTLAMATEKKQETKQETKQEMK